jgi:hypothetical protein
VGSRSKARARAQVSESGNTGRPQRPRNGPAGPAQRPPSKPSGPAQRPLSGPSGPQQRPVSLVGAAIVQAAEAAGVLAASILAGMDAGAGRSYHTSSGVALTLIGIVTAVALGYVAFGLTRARRWSRTPALLTQLFTAIVGIYLVEGHRYEWGTPALILAGAGFAALLVPPSLRALAGPPPADRPGPPGR